MICYKVRYILNKKKWIVPFENQRDYPLFVHLDLSQTKKRNKTAHISKDFVTGV